jgi:hypothetical protein
MTRFSTSSLKLILCISSHKTFVYKNKINEDSTRDEYIARAAQLGKELDKEETDKVLKKSKLSPI